MSVSIPVSALKLDNRRTIRSEVNPYDKSTVVSIYPKHIHEEKVTIQPGVFDIKPGTFEKPSLLVVGSSSWWRDVDPEQPLLEIPVSSLQVADSIVKDYCNAMIGSNMGDSMPGLFYVPGEVNVEKVKKEYSHLLQRAKERQENWYKHLVKLGDALWARANGNPLAIAEDMRLASNELGYQREWTKNYQAAELVKCFACGSLRNSLYPICPSCKVVDKTHPAAKELIFAQ
jgi:hypothetical protein